MPDFVERCKELAPAKIVLIKATVYDAAYGLLSQAGLPVVEQRIAFPGSGRQADFRRQFAAALEMAGSSASQPESPSTRHPSPLGSQEGHSFTRAQADAIRELIRLTREADRPDQKKLRRQLRSMGFRISDYSQGNEGFTVADFDALVARGTITLEERPVT